MSDLLDKVTHVRKTDGRCYRVLSACRDDDGKPVFELADEPEAEPVTMGVVYIEPDEPRE
jgi:hypothetical protein